MNLKKHLKNTRILFAALGIYLIVLLIDQSIFLKALDKSLMYIKEMLQVLVLKPLHSLTLGMWSPFTPMADRYQG